MPLGLKLTLLTLETSLVSNLLWTDITNVELIESTVSKNQTNRLTKRVLHQGAYTLHFLVKKL